MPALTLKGIPTERHQKLKASAKDKRMSLNAYAISILEAHEEERDRMRRNRGRLEAFVAAMPELPDPNPFIREDRG